MIARLIGVFVILACIAGPSQAQDFPNRPIRVVVGPGPDIVARVFGAKVGELLGQPVVVEPRPGAGGLIAAQTVAAAPPDGYTLLQATASYTINTALQSGQLDLRKDYAPVGQVSSIPFVLVLHPSVPAKTLAELIAHAKANPGKLSVATSGVGTPHHLALIMLNNAAGIDMVHVPYRGTTPALNDVLGGTIPLLWSTPVGLMQFVEQGRLKALGVTTPQRVAMLPQVPALAESAVPGFDLQAWLGIAGPAGLPAEIATRLMAAIREIIDMPDVRKRITDVGQSLDFRPGAEFRDALAADHEKFGAIIRAAGIQPN
jgi:tripartite-type tricarboxylate transporter receptor subunit TctC